MRLEGKVAVVTGAAAGIGRAIARRYTEEGARVVLADINEAKLAKTAEQLTEAGADVKIAVTDVSDKAQIEAMIAAATEGYGQLDILVNNAGVLDGLTPIHSTTDELWDTILAINLTGPFYAMRLAIAHFLENGGGAIVNTCSAASVRGGRGGAAYTASKHGLLGLTRNVAWYYGPQKIRCNGIAPGAIKTGMAAGGGVAPPSKEGMDRLKPHYLGIPPRGRSSEVAEAAVFLGSDEASYVNGALIAVDGGWISY